MAASAAVAAEAGAASRTPYAKLSDQQLTALLANRLDGMDEAERRALFSEVKLRMARHKGGDRAIRLQTERRYGWRLIRQRDGSVVRIRTQMVRVRPVQGGQQSFGVGFEERTKQAQPAMPEASAPPVRIVNDPSP